MKRSTLLQPLALAAIALVATLNPACSCGDNGTTAPNKTGCGSDCNQPCLDPLPQGLIGSYTSVAVAKNGTTWVSGYNERPIDPNLADSTLYGDLVVGQYDGAKNAVAWKTVDGLPAPVAGQCPDNDPKGWRQGILDSGPDVGLWTSMQLDSSDHPMVVYYDATNGQAKFATFDGNNWASYVLANKAKADLGRYAKMILVNGKPVVAFLGLEAGNAGYTRSRVIVGTANTATPTSASAWTFEDAAVDETSPCNGRFCPDNQVCVANGTFDAGILGTCVPAVAGCMPACATGKACVNVGSAATCATTVDTTAPVSYPAVFGDYVSLANGPSGLGLAVYDRVRGNLVGVTKLNSKWTSTILDGQLGANDDPNRKNTGDVGVAATLAIAANGDWHLVYVNGLTEQLEYMLILKGLPTAPNAPEVVDDGTNSGKPYVDGIHIIGDDATITVDPNGDLHVAYQDSTAGTLRYATGVATGTAHTWTAKTVAQQVGFAGFFPRFIPGGSQITNFFRHTDHTTGSVTGDVAFATP